MATSRGPLQQPAVRTPMLTKPRTTPAFGCLTFFYVARILQTRLVHFCRNHQIGPGNDAEKPAWWRDSPLSKKLCCETLTLTSPKSPISDGPTGPLREPSTRATSCASRSHGCDTHMNTCKSCVRQNMAAAECETTHRVCRC